MSLHRLDRRFAMYIFSIKGIGNSPSMLLIACGGITALISMWISNTAATAIMLPICIGIISAMERRSSKLSLKYRTGMMLMIAYGASVGGIGTPVGSPPNLIAIGMIESLTHYRITFFQWMALGVPMLIIMFIVLSIILMFLHTPPSMAEPTAGLIHDTDDDGGGWSRGEIYTLISFGTAVVFWVLPGVIAVVSGVESGLYKSLKGVLDEGVVALGAAFLLFILPVNWKKRTFAISWEQAVKIDWGTILLFGGGLSLGKLMFDTGLANIIGTRITDIAGVDGLWGITALSVITGILVSEVTSNTASASMVIPSNDSNISGRRRISTSTGPRRLSRRQLWFYASCINTAKCDSVWLRHGADTLNAQGRCDFRRTWFYNNMDRPAYTMSFAWVYLDRPIFMFLGNKIFDTMLSTTHIEITPVLMKHLLPNCAVKHPPD